MEIPFRYSPQVFQSFPRLSGGALLVEGIQNGPSPTDLQDLFLQEQHRVLEKIGSTPLSELEALAGWRSAFRQFGVDPTQYRSAAEALLRRLTKKGDIPSINALVDICNLVSIRYALPVAAFDLGSIQSPITVRFATGDEQFINLGEAAPEHPTPGEVIFTDQGGLVVARRWCWRQSEESAAREDTRTALITIEAQSVGGFELIQAAIDDLQTLLTVYSVGGNYTRQLPVET